MEKKYFLANPNFSEARDIDIVEKIVDAARNIDGVKLVKYEPEAEFNRTVVTLVGEIEPLKNVLTELTVKCVDLIDMRKHTGTHPRMGVMDVIPVYPFKNTTIDEAVIFCQELADKIFEETKIPIFFTGANAKCEKRKKLPFIRK
ncbi:MAG: glutamate formimidoyltransferase, partial [Candidatus Aminicenantes bacterium]|nr:glutamate formimidoyltransferase [Candidatus Aminicenantes bacterium]